MEKRLSQQHTANKEYHQPQEGKADRFAGTRGSFSLAGEFDGKIRSKDMGNQEIPTTAVPRPPPR